MANGPSGESEPIEAEFEPTDGDVGAGAKATGKQAKRKRPITWVELGGGLVLSALIGAGMATVVGQSGSGTSTGTFVGDLNTLTKEQETLVSRADEVSDELVRLRAQVDAQAETLSERTSDEASLRQDIDALNEQLTALVGASDEADSDTTGTPLAQLMARLTELEETLKDDISSPQTTRQMQRALTNLSDRVEALDAASTDLTTAVERRRAAMVSLENGLERLGGELNVLRGQVKNVENVGSEIGEVRQSVTALADATEAERAPVIAAAEASRIIRALSALETEANKGGKFVDQHRALAALMPDDPDVEALRDMARKKVPTLEQLRTEYRRAANRAEKDAAAKVDDGWGWLRGAMSGVVTVRRTDADTATLQYLSDARSALDAADVAGAIVSVEKLDGDAANAFKDWKERAEMRVAFEDHLDGLNATILAAPTGVTAPVSAEDEDQ